ncbi:divalent metal cation transporter [Amycolatopsis silviterrae]|uniref:Divalent metal cation transporter n=1 Tax=Amycolatopsis silviterrae TaxID=1656914 RepID=A0ABW5GZZ4_9PSEU
MTTDTVVRIDRRTTAVLDEEHVGDIRGVLGTIEAGDSAPRTGLSAKFKTLLAIVGPGLIVLSVLDLLLLNALTLVTEFIGITMATRCLGLPTVPSVALAAAVIIGAAFTGSFRRFERIAIFFCLGSLTLIPVYVFAHPAGMLGGPVPTMPAGPGGMAELMLLVLAIVGAFAASWGVACEGVLRGSRRAVGRQWWPRPHGWVRAARVSAPGDGTRHREAHPTGVRLTLREIASQRAHRECAQQWETMTPRHRKVR